MSVSVSIKQRDKTSTTRRTTQVWSKSANANEFLNQCFQSKKSHNFFLSFNIRACIGSFV